MYISHIYTFFLYFFFIQSFKQKKFSGLHWPQSPKPEAKVTKEQTCYHCHFHHGINWSGITSCLHQGRI